MKRDHVFGSLLILALAATLSGCLQHTYDIGTGAPDGEIVYQNWHHHWLFGLIRPELQEVLEIDRHCPSGNATIHQERSFVNGLVDVLIGILYSPTTVTIRCANGAEAEAELTREEAAELVADPAFLEVVALLAPERLEETRLALSRQGDPATRQGSALAAR